MPLLLVTMAVSKNSFTAFIMYSVSMNTVDIGLAQLAMHSPYETAGIMDTEYMIKAVKEFFETAIVTNSNGTFTLE